MDLIDTNRKSCSSMQELMDSPIFATQHHAELRQYKNHPDTEQQPSTSYIPCTNTATATRMAALAIKHETSRSNTPSSDEDEVDSSSSDERDSRDAASVSEPMHRHLHAPAQMQPMHKQGLTLSAFRRSAVRLTGCDLSRRLTDYYDTTSKVLGHGAFSTVRLAIRKHDGVQVAVKTIAKHDALRTRRGRSHDHQEYLEEWDILRRMRHHPHIISLLDVFETDEEILLVMEYCRGGELFRIISKGLPESQALSITQQILTALRDLHASGIVHRDVKPENILLAGKGIVKLCDFGTARSVLTGDASPLTPVTQRTRAYSMLGSNYYVAPEVSSGTAYDTAVDMYSLGVTIYVLLTGVAPATGADGSTTSLTFPSQVSAAAQAFVRRLLHPDAEKRLTAEQALQDPWIRSIEGANVTTHAGGWGDSSDGIRSRNHRRLPHVATTPSTSWDLDLVRSELYRAIGPAAEPQSRKRPNTTVAALAQRKKKRKYCPITSETSAGPSQYCSVPASHATSTDATASCRKRQASALLAFADLYCCGVVVAAAAAAAAASESEMDGCASPSVVTVAAQGNVEDLAEDDEETDGFCVNNSNRTAAFLQV